MKFVRPINTGGNPANISTVFGPYHPGIDYAYPEGTKVYASESGKITIAKGNERRQWVANRAGDPYYVPGGRALRNEDYGNMLKIDHGGGNSSLYAHLKYDSLYVKVGENVVKGQLIAEVGSTGNSTGNHLHWEVRYNEQTFDPSGYFDSSFTGYKDSTAPSSPSTPVGQVAVDAAVFPIIIHGSTQWDRTANKYIPGKKPSAASFEDLEKVVGGIQGHYNDLSRQLNDARSEIINREQQVSRLKEQVLEVEGREKSLSDQLKKTTTGINETVRVYQEQLKEKQLQVDDIAAQKGEALKEAAYWKAKYENAAKGVTTKSLWDTILEFLKNTKVVK